MSCSSGSIVLVPFPFTDLPIRRRRPALVLSSQAFNEQNQQTVLVMITTAAASSWRSDVVVSDWRNAGLVSACVVRMKVFTLENSLILRVIGTLAPPDHTSVRSQVAETLGLRVLV